MQSHKIGMGCSTSLSLMEKGKEQLMGTWKHAISLIHKDFHVGKINQHIHTHTKDFLQTLKGVLYPLPNISMVCVLFQNYQHLMKNVNHMASESKLS